MLLASSSALFGTWDLIYGPWSYTRVALVAMGGPLVYLCVLIIYRRFCWLYTVDQEHIESHRGILARRVRSIRIRDLRNVNVRQSIAQRLFGVGDVEFSSAAGGDIEVTFFGVADPLEVKDLAQRLQGE